MLSDGRDASDTDLQKAVDAITASKVRVDVVSLGEDGDNNPPLEAMASEGGGKVLAAQDPDALTELFNEEAAALARQVLVTAALPEGFDATEGSVAISVEAGGETYSDTAFVSFGKVATEAPPRTAAGPLPVEPPSPLMNQDALWGGTRRTRVSGVLVVLLGAFGVFGKRDKETLEDKISAYTRAGAAKNAKAAAARAASATGSARRHVAESAVDLAQKALEGNAGFEAKLGGKLEGADISLKPAEWILRPRRHRARSRRSWASC